jgi:hypothetical protein
MRIGNGNRPPHQLHWGQIVDVVAEICGPLCRHAMLTQPGANGLRFSFDPVQYVDLQFGCTRSDHPVGLLGQDQDRHPGLPQPFHTQAVGPADPHGLVPVLVHGGRVVGVHPVEVGDHHVDVQLHPWIDRSGQ